MIVYVESNFVLELALQQEEHGDCERILEFAEANRIELVIPVYSLAEPYDTWHRRAREREDLTDKLDQQLTQLSRSERYAEVVESSTSITRLLTRSIQQDKKRIDGLCERMLTAATVVSLDRTTVSASLEAQRSRDLSPQDALVYASILSHLQAAAREDVKVFVTRDPDDFLTPEIEEDLGALGARLLVSFEDASAFVAAAS